MKPGKFILVTLVIACWIGCKSKEQVTQDPLAQYTVMGNRIVKNTFDTLRHSLQSAISQAGYENAVTYCKTAALSLTNTYGSDSIRISRTSLKYRNPANKPGIAEAEVLTSFEDQISQGIKTDSLKPIIIAGTNGTVHFYKPILLQPMCIACHGSKSADIAPAVWDQLQTNYPSDMAYDYKVGDLRGMWHITFEKK